MARPTNFADPDFEPTDEELQQLSHEAFAGVAAQHLESDALLRTQIAELRIEARARLRELVARFWPERSSSLG